MDTVQELNIHEGKYIVKALKLGPLWIMDQAVSLGTPVHEGPAAGLWTDI